MLMYSVYTALFARFRLALHPLIEIVNRLLRSMLEPPEGSAVRERKNLSGKLGHDYSDRCLGKDPKEDNEGE